MARLFWIAWVVSIAGLQAPLRAQSPGLAAQWWAVDRYVVDQLLQRDRAEWVKQVLAEPMPDDAAALMVRFNLLVRDGRHLDPRNSPSEIESTLAALSKHLDTVDDYEWSQLVDFLIDREEDDAARLAIHYLPTAQPGWGYVLVKRMVEGGQPQHTVSTREHTDRWVVDWETAARQRLAKREPQPWRGDGSEDYWFILREHLHRHAGTIPWLSNAIQEQLRAQPDDLTAAMRCVTLSTSVNPPQSPQWMLEVYKPASAYEAYRLGEALTGPWPAVAAAMFEKSLAMPFGDADVAAMLRLSMMQQRAMGPRTREDVERSVRWQTRSALAAAYQKSDQAAKAQPLIEAIAKESGGDVPPSLAQLSGRVQATTGERVIEGRILEAEKARADSPEYWQRRAHYFEGRAEHEEADAAYRKAIELAPLDVSPRFKDSTFYRSQAVRDYVRYLRKQKRDDEAIALIWREFDSVALDSEYAERMVNAAWDLDRNDCVLLTVDNDRLWRWLAARAVWDHLEDRVLYRMCDRAGRDGVGQVWAKALPLVKDADPSRATVLGWVMTRNGADAQAVPLLKNAMARLDDVEKKERAVFTLFEAYLHLNDVKNAEAIWPEASKRLGPREIPEWLEKLIESAKKSGDAATAQRLAQVRANLDYRRMPR